jgi:hypothetical protein
VTAIAGPLFQGGRILEEEARGSRGLEGGFCTSFGREAEVEGRSNEGDEKWSKAEKA